MHDLQPFTLDITKHLLFFFYSRFTESCCRTYKLARPEVSNKFLPIIATSFASIYDQSNAQGKHYLRHGDWRKKYSQ